MKQKSLLMIVVLLIGMHFQATADVEPTNDVYSGAETMAENGSVSGTIGIPSTDQNDWYIFNTTDDGSVNLYLDHEPGMYHRIYLYDSDGTTSLGSAEGFDNASQTVNNLAAGTYYARVYYYSSSYMSNYTLTNTVTPATLANDSEPNDSPGTALTMAENGSVIGHIGFRYNGGSYDTDDWYIFNTTNDGVITLELVHDPGMYHRIYLYDSDGTTSLGSAEGTGSATFTKNNLAAGTYYARVYYFSSTYYSGYTLTNTATPATPANDSEPNDLYTEANTSIAEDGFTTGHIGFRENGGGFDTEDWYTVSMADAGTITLELTNQTGQYFGVYLYDNNGTTSLGSNFEYDTAKVIVKNLEAGDYYIKVDSYSSTYYSGYKLQYTTTSATYTADSELNDDYTLASVSVPENGMVEGRISYRRNGGTYDTNDWYHLVSTSDGAITLNISMDPGMYHGIYLYDENGTTSLGNNFNYGSASITVFNLQAGNYYAKVDNYSSTYYSGYELEFVVTPTPYTNDPEPNGTIGTASPMLTNSTVEGHIGFRGNGTVYDTEDYWEFTLSEMGEVTLSTLTSDLSQYHGIYLYNSGGFSLGNNFGYGTTSLTIVDLVPGIYYAKVDNYSATYYSSYQLTNTYCPDAITIVAEGETTLCEGESVILTTPDHHWSYLWNDGSTTETNAVTLAGDFSLTIDNGDGCVRTSNTLAVDVTPNPVAVLEADGPTTFCEGGSVTITANVPGSPDSYLWSNGETTSSITVSESGDYSVTIYKNDCSAISDPIAITVNPNPTATVTADGSTTLCEGEDVMLTANTASSYLWSNGETTQSITVSESGNYSVTITNENSCTDESDAVAVTVNPIPVATISAGGDTEFCEGGSVMLTASSGDSYLWSTGQTSASISATSEGSYSVTVTENGCSATSSNTDVTVNANPTPSISADGLTTFCEGGSVNLSVDSYFDIVWSTGENTESINVNEAGVYNVTVTNDNGCMGTSSDVTVTTEVCTELVIFADGPTTFCEGGSVILSSSEEAGNVWNTGATTQSITVTESGDYSCVNGDNTSNTITVTVNANPEATISADGDTQFCEGGSVMLTASAGDSYLWSTGETSASIVASSEGLYSVTVTQDGCSATSENTDVTINANPTPEISADGPTTFCDGGSVNLSVDSYFDILWSTGANTESINVTESGSYSVTVTDAKGCSGEAEAVEVTVESCGTEVTIIAEGETTFCAGGSVILTSSEATGNIWSTGETTQSITATESGDYSVSNGAFVSNTITVTVVEEASVSVSPIGPDKICYEGSVLLSATASSGDLQWQRNGMDISGETGSSLTVTESGHYTRTVDNGVCDAATSNSVKVTYYKNLPITPAGTSYICDGSSVVLSVDYYATVTYQWYRNGVEIIGATANIYEATTTGKYRVVSTLDGCGRVSNIVQVIVDCRFASESEIESQLWPNPTSESFNISTTAEENAKLIIQIYDISGSEVFAMTHTQSYSGEILNINLPDLASGMYSVVIHFPNGTMNQHPLVINK
ncbi:MAG: T9SS type A sorting domain-containing protein [Bacteroidetes bacterium]|nr:T9SS type A sorting domain-containing protein [Bacteroidota bacterium]